MYARIKLIYVDYAGVIRTKTSSSYIFILGVAKLNKTGACVSTIRIKRHNAQLPRSP